MNKLITTSAIFIILILSTVFTTIYTANKFTEFSTELSEINTLLEANLWNLAKTKIKSLNSNFTSHEKTLQLFLNRDNLEKIQQNLNKLQTAILFQEKSKTTSQTLNLQNQFQKIMDDEKPLIHNIL